MKSGFGQNTGSAVVIGLADDAVILSIPAYTETVTINTTNGDVEFQTPTCSGTGTALVNGELIGDATGADASEDGPQESEEESTAEAGGDDTSPAEGSSGIPWDSIALAIALVAAVTAYGVNRSRTKKDCKPEEEALDAATRAASLAHKAATEKEAAVQEAIKNDALRSRRRKLEPRQIRPIPQPRRLWILIVRRVPPTRPAKVALISVMRWIRVVSVWERLGREPTLPRPTPSLKTVVLRSHRPDRMSSAIQPMRPIRTRGAGRK